MALHFHACFVVSADEQLAALIMSAESVVDLEKLWSRFPRQELAGLSKLYCALSLMAVRDDYATHQVWHAIP